MHINMYLHGCECWRNNRVFVTVAVQHLVGVFISPPSGVLKVTGSLLGPFPFLLKTLTVSVYSEKASRLGTMACVLFPGNDSMWRSSKILSGLRKLRFRSQWTWKKQAMGKCWPREGIKKIAYPTRLNHGPVLFPMFLVIENEKSICGCTFQI